MNEAESSGAAATAVVVNNRGAAHAMYEKVEEHYECIERDAVPKAEDDIQSLFDLMNGKKNSFLTDRRVNLIFKDKKLLKSAMRARKKRRRGFEGEEERILDDNFPLDDKSALLFQQPPQPEESSERFVANFNAPEQAPTFAALNRTIKWHKTDFENIQKKADDHLAYLRRLKFKTWDKMSRSEHTMIKEYIQKTNEWIARIKDHIDLNEFVFKAIPLLNKIDECAKEVASEVKATHNLERVSKIDKSSGLLIEARAAAAAAEAESGGSGGGLAVVAASSSSSALTTAPSSYSSNWISQGFSDVIYDRKPKLNTIDAQVNVMRSDSHKQLGIMLKDMESLCNYYLSLYGNVRGSGDVVDNPQVQNATSAPALQIDNQDDPWVVSGLICADCGVMRVINHREGIASCPQCGTCVQYQSNDLAACNFGDEPEMKNSRRRNYKPESYAAQWLRKVSGNLGVEVPEEVITTLFADFHRRRFEKVTPKIVKSTLKRHKLNEYYKCVPFLTYKFNEIPLAKFSDEEVEILEQMFDEYREAFIRCPMEIKKRSNLMSYAYFYYKAVEIRGWYHYMKCFPLLEGDKHIRQHDRTWQWICNNKHGGRWKFFPTSKM